MLKQITVFLENKLGRMEDVTGCLAENNINIHALSIADTTDFGILRIIVAEPEKTARILRDNNFMVKTADVIAIPIGHSPGSLHKVLMELKTLNISIEYLYAFTSHHKDFDAVVILSLRDQQTAAEKLITEKNLPILDESFLNQLDEG